MSTHTPGPWHVGADWPQIVAVYDARAIYVAHATTGVGSEWIGSNPLGLDVAKANARLIAAAPDMLAALLYWRNECSGAEPSISVFNRMVDEALAKATGSSGSQATAQA